MSKEHQPAHNYSWDRALASVAIAGAKTFEQFHAADPLQSTLALAQIFSADLARVRNSERSLVDKAVHAIKTTLLKPLYGIGIHNVCNLDEKSIKKMYDRLQPEIDSFGRHLNGLSGMLEEDVDSVSEWSTLYQQRTQDKQAVVKGLSNFYNQLTEDVDVVAEGLREDGEFVKLKIALESYKSAFSKYLVDPYKQRTFFGKLAAVALPQCQYYDPIDLTPEFLTKLHTYGLIEYVDPKEFIDGAFATFGLGKEYREQKLDRSAQPKATEVSRQTLAERMEKWETAKNNFRSGQLIAAGILSDIMRQMASDGQFLDRAWLTSDQVGHMMDTVFDHPATHDIYRYASENVLPPHRYIDSPKRVQFFPKFAEIAQAMKTVHGFVQEYPTEENLRLMGQTLDMFRAMVRGMYELKENRE